MTTEVKTNPVIPSVMTDDIRTHIFPVKPPGDAAFCGFKAERGAQIYGSLPKRKVCERCAELFEARYGKSWEQHILDKGL